MKIGILGYGWLGERIGDFLKGNHQIFGTTRSPEKAEKLTQKGIKALHWKNKKDLEKLNDCDVLIFSLPVSKRKFDSLSLQYLLPIIKGFQKQIIVFSSTGIYPPEPKIYTEKQTENLNPNILAYETFFQKYFPQSIILRFGGLMGDNRNFARFFQQKEIPNPNEAVNHIHYQDIIHIIEWLITKKTAANIYNVVAPLHPTKKEVFLRQTKQKVPSHFPTSTPSRMICSEKLIQDLDYTFLFPNPAAF